MTTTTTTNRYLQDGFAPVSVEHTVTDLQVTGVIPDYLDGRYVRNGPNPLGPVDPASYHWFTGTGMLHGLRLRDGRAEWYRNRWVRSAATAAALGEPERPGPRHAGMDLAPNTNVIAHAGRTLAIVEGGALPYAVSDELETLGPCDFDGTLPGGYTAHPLVDPVTGELHAVSYFWGWGSRVRYSVTGTDGRVRRVVDLDVSGSLMMHAFSLTERYVVLYDLPVTFDLAKASPAARRLPAVARRRSQALLDRRGMPAALARPLNGRQRPDGAFPYSWDGDRPARVGLLPRDAGPGDLRWYEVGPCYVYHPLNAHDTDDGKVVADVVRHPSTFVTDPHGPVDGAPTLDRWTIEPQAPTVREERLDDRPQEFPRIDERRVGHHQRYGYAVEIDGTGTPGPALFRHDTASGTAQARRFDDGVQLSEFVFVPAAPDAGEDQGALVGYAYDRRTDRSALHILDAASLETAAVVDLPARVPHGFHGNWLPAGA